MEVAPPNLLEVTVVGVRRKAFAANAREFAIGSNDTRLPAIALPMVLGHKSPRLEDVTLGVM